MPRSEEFPGTGESVYEHARALNRQGRTRVEVAAELRRRGVDEESIGVVTRTLPWQAGEAREASREPPNPPSPTEGPPQQAVSRLRGQLSASLRVTAVAALILWAYASLVIEARWIGNLLAAALLAVVIWPLSWCMLRLASRTSTGNLRASTLGVVIQAFAVCGLIVSTDGVWWSLGSVALPVWSTALLRQLIRRRAGAVARGMARVLDPEPRRLDPRARRQRRGDRGLLRQRAADRLLRGAAQPAGGGFSAPSSAG